MNDSGNAPSISDPDLVSSKPPRGWVTRARRLIAEYDNNTGDLDALRRAPPDDVEDEAESALLQQRQGICGELRGCAYDSRDPLLRALLADRQRALFGTPGRIDQALSCSLAIVDRVRRLMYLNSRPRPRVVQSQADEGPPPF